MRIFIYYLLVFTHNLGCGALFYTASKRIAFEGGTPLEASLTFAAWSAPYALSSLLASRWIRSDNAGAFAIVGSLISLLGIGIFCAFSHFTALYFAMIIIGLGGALFMSPMISLIKRASGGARNASPLRTAGFVTCTWSTGCSAGPLLAGFFWPLGGGGGWRIAFLIWATGYLAYLTHWKHLSNPPEARGKEKASSAAPYAGFPDLLRLGWLVGIVGCSAIALLRSLLPYKTSLLGIPPVEDGAIQTLLNLTQAGTACVLAFGSYWMFRAKKVLLLGMAGTVGMLLLAFGHSAGPLGLGCVAFGLYSGMFYTYWSFHALLDPTRSAANLSINEFFAGLTGVLSPLCAGLLALWFSNDVPFALGALPIALVTLIQWKILGRIKKRRVV